MKKRLRRWLGRLAPKLEKIAIYWSENYLLGKRSRGLKFVEASILIPLALWFKHNLGKTAGSRVVPLKVDIPARLQNLSLNSALELVRRAPKVTVVECYCRNKYQKCQAPRNNCLVFEEPVLVDDLNPVVQENPDFPKLKAILEEAQSYGLLHQALFFPDPKTVYCICNCCECCCLSFQVKNNGYKLLQKSPFMIEFNRENCVECGKCEKVCISKAIRLNEGVKIKLEDCLGCGLCEHSCTAGALNLVVKEDCASDDR